MPPDHHGHDLTTSRIKWPQAWRIIATRYPPINLFERVSTDPAVWDVLVELEQATNPRVRDETGEISLVPPNRRVSGPNASWVMAPFTHLNPKGSRFSNGSYGVYYAARELKTAIRETAYHFERFALDSHDGVRNEDMRVLLGSIDHPFEEIDSLPNAARTEILDPNSYAASQPFALSRRQIGSDGLSYPSVRHKNGRCIAAFWPDVVGIPIQERHLRYEWDGIAVRRYFDFSSDAWLLLE
jgi:RES domain